MHSLRSFSSRVAVAAALTFIVFAVPASAQTPLENNHDAENTPALVGCSGISWSRTATPTGAGLPVVEDVEGPADKSGLRAGDVILAVDGQDVRNMDTWFSATPGHQVTLKVQRGRKVTDVVVSAGRVVDLGPEKFEVRCVNSR